MTADARATAGRCPGSEQQEQVANIVAKALRWQVQFESLKPDGPTNWQAWRLACDNLADAVDAYRKRKDGLVRQHRAPVAEGQMQDG